MFSMVTMELLQGFGESLKVFGLTLLFSIPLGLLICFGSMSGFQPLRTLSRGFVWVIRGTPLMLQLIIIFYGPGLMFGLPAMPRFTATIVAFSINYACYFSEIYRGGIESIPVGQYEAGQVLGMTKSQIFFRVVLLQVVKRITAPMGNEIITLVKDTSLARVIGIYELIWAGEQFIKKGLIWPLFYTGAFYLLFSGLLTILLGRLEKKLDYFRGSVMALLEVKNIKKTFDSNQVLKDVSFSLEEGQVLAIIGSSGSGKTTLLRCLNFLEMPDSGEILVQGKQLLSESEEEIRQNRLHFGLVFQNFNLFPQYTVYQNVTLAPTLLNIDTPEAIKERAHQLISRVGLSQKENSYPYQLSGGQQQRVAIARALAMNPQVLCFDEPTSALDPELTGEVLRVIRELKNTHSTMIVVTHEMEFAKSVADVVMYMADGVIEEMGPPEQIFENPQSEKTRAFLQASLEEF